MADTRLLMIAFRDNVADSELQYSEHTVQTIHFIANIEWINTFYTFSLKAMDYIFVGIRSVNPFWEPITRKLSFDIEALTYERNGKNGIGISDSSLCEITQELTYWYEDNQLNYNYTYDTFKQVSQTLLHMFKFDGFIARTLMGNLYFNPFRDIQPFDQKIVNYYLLIETRIDGFIRICETDMGIYIPRCINDIIFQYEDSLGEFLLFTTSAFRKYIKKNIKNISAWIKKTKHLSSEEQINEICTI